MNNHPFGETHSSAAAAPATSGLHSWSTSWDSHGSGPAARVAPADGVAASGPINGYSDTGSHLHGAPLSNHEYSNFHTGYSSQLIDREHRAQVGDHSSLTNQPVLQQGQFLYHEHVGFPPQAAAGDASMATHQQCLYKGDIYSQEHQRFAGSSTAFSDLHPTSYPANPEESGHGALRYFGSGDAAAHFDGPTESAEEQALRLQVANMSIGDQQDSPALQPGAHPASYRGPQGDFTSPEKVESQGLAAASGPSSHLGHPGPALEATRALSAGSERDFFGGLPHAAGGAAAPEHAGTAGSASAIFLPAGVGNSIASSHPVLHAEAGSFEWLAVTAAAPGDSRQSSAATAQPLSGVPPSEQHRRSGDAGISTGAPWADRNHVAQDTAEPRRGGEVRQSRGGSTSALLLASIPKPDVLGEPFSAVHSAPDDSVQPDILPDDPCFHQPRQLHGELLRERATGGGEEAGAAAEAAAPQAASYSHVPGALVPGSSAVQPMQHSVMIGYEPISPHSQSAFKAVGTGRLSSRSEGAATAGFVRSSSPALWQNDMPLQPTVYLQPVDLSSSDHLVQSATSRNEAVPPPELAGASVVTTGRASVATTGKSSNGGAAAPRGSADATAAASTPGSAPGELTGRATRQPLGSRDSEPAAAFGAAALYSQSVWPQMSEGSTAVHAVVPHPVPVPIFLRSPHDVGLAASSFSPRNQEFGEGALQTVDLQTPDTSARRQSADTQVGQAWACGSAAAAGSAAPAAQLPSQSALGGLQPSASGVLPLAPLHATGGSRYAPADPRAAAPAGDDARSHGVLLPPPAAGSSAGQPLDHLQLRASSVSTKLDDERAVKLAASLQQQPSRLVDSREYLQHDQETFRQLPPLPVSSPPQGHAPVESSGGLRHGASLERPLNSAALGATAQLAWSSDAASAQTSAGSLSGTSQLGSRSVPDQASQRHFSVADAWEGARSGRGMPEAATYASDASRAGYSSSSTNYSAGGQSQDPGAREMGSFSMANRMDAIALMQGSSREPPHHVRPPQSDLGSLAASSSPQPRASAPPAQFVDARAAVPLTAAQGHTDQAMHGHGPYQHAPSSGGGTQPTAVDTDQRLAAAAAAFSGRQFAHGSGPSFDQDSRPVPHSQDGGHPSAPMFSPPPGQGDGQPPSAQDYRGSQSIALGGQAGAQPFGPPGSATAPQQYFAQSGGGNGSSGQPPTASHWQAAGVDGSFGPGGRGALPAGAAGSVPSLSYGGTGVQAAAGMSPWQQQPVPVAPAQGYGQQQQHSGAMPVAHGYGTLGPAAQYQQPYDRRPPSVQPPQPSPYTDYYAQYYSGAGYGHYMGQNVYGGYQNRGYAYDNRQSNPYYEPSHGAYNRGYYDELNSYAQQQAAAAAAYGSMYDYYQQYQQYYNAVQDSQLKLAHSRSSSRAVTPCIQGRDERSSYGDNQSSYYPSRPESVASVGVYSSGAAATAASLTVQHDAVAGDYGEFEGSSLDATAAGTADYDYSYAAAGSHGSTDVGAAPSAVVPSRQTPACFPLPHSRVRFSKCGQLLTVLPNNPAEGQPALVQVHDLKHFLDQSAIGGAEPKNFLSEHAYLSFPLVRGQTHKKDVVEFCDRQAEKCRSSAGVHDRESSELMWRFLALLVKQNGTYVGSDIAELLLAGQDGALGGYKRHSQVPDAAAAESQKSVDAHTDRFRELLLYGHVKEALDYAAKNELWGHALCLASKMDVRTLASVIARFTTSSMKSNDPLQTLYQLMSSKQPSVVTSIADDKWGSWRPHLAMMLVNAGNSNLIHQSVVQLGDTLAAKGQLVASQFCYIMSGLSFESYSKKSAKLSLLGAHSRMVEKEFLSTEFIEWTEVYEYAQSLGNPIFIMPSLQTYKLVKAWNHFEHGRLWEALRYCETIAEKVVAQPSLFPTEMVKQLVELSALLKHQNAEDAQHLGTSGFVDPSCSLPWLDKLNAVHERLEAGTYDTTLMPSVVANAHGTNLELPTGNAVAQNATSDSSRSAPHYRGHDEVPGVQQHSASGADANILPAATTNSVQHYDYDAETSVDHYGGPAEVAHWNSYNQQSKVAGLPELPSSKNSLYQQPPESENSLQWASSEQGRGQTAHYSDSTDVYTQQHQPLRDPWLQPRSAQEQHEETLSTTSDDTGESMDEDYARLNPVQPFQQPSEQSMPTEIHNSKEAHSKTDTAARNKEPSKGIFGLFGYFSKPKAPKAPKAAKMKLPDDKEKPIVWDSVKGQWVDTSAGAEEEKVVGPPPQMSAPSASITSKGSTPGADMPPGTSSNIYSMSRGKRLPAYVDPFKGTPSVTSSPVPSLLSDGLSKSRPMTVLTPLGFMPASQSNADVATSSDQLQISRNESSASLEVQNIMGLSGQETVQPAPNQQPVVSTGPSFYNPSQFSHSIPASTTKQRLNRRV